MTDKILAGGGDDYVPLRELEPGDRVRLRGEILAEVVENPRDGMWIVVRYVDRAGDDLEMVGADDVVGRA